MTDHPTTRDQLIEQAAQALVRNVDVIAALVKACKCCASSGYEPGGGAPYPSECRWCDHEPDRHGETAMAKLRGPVGHALAGLLADPEQHADGVVRDRLRRARVEREQLAVVRTERDALQARIDRVTETCEAAATGIAIGMARNPVRWECAEAAIEDVRAALQGDQPEVSDD